MVVRIDGRGFTKFCESVQMVKPNDIRGINLMNRAAVEVINNMKEIVIAYGQSDEYSFVFKRRAKVFDRREDKILTTVVSLFSSAYVYHQRTYFPDLKALSTVIPSFDGRLVLYPSLEDLKNYLNWRQVDCHVNNLYNTTFWALV
jgi:tRNA(His) guanylyltransferase